MRILFMWIFAAAIPLTACSGDSSTSCADTSDCFQGETCVGGTCEPEDGIGDGGTNNGGENNGGENNGSGNNGSGNNGTNNATNNGTTSTNNDLPDVACVVDLFGNQCEDDEWEENDGYSDGIGPDQTGLPWDSGSWCDGDTLVDPERTFSAKSCAKDPGDAWRFPVSNNGPVCIDAASITIRFTVDIQTECDPSLIEVKPYLFGRDHIRYDSCSDEYGDVRCETENGGQTHVIDFLFDQAQSFDPRLWITATHEEVQFDYDVTMEIIE